METSFDTLFRQFYAPMVLYADSRLNDREQAEDVVQDVFSKLLETGFSTGDPAKARQYLFTVLRNKVIDLEVKCGEKGRLYGSVTAAEVAEALEKQHGVQVDKRKIDIGDSIREVGVR